MPKRISDVSLHVYVTPENLERIVEAVRTALDDHLLDRDVFAWRFTLPAAPDDPLHAEFETHWRAENSDAPPTGYGTYEIALSLVGDPTELTDTDMAALQSRLRSGIASATTQQVPLRIRAHQRTDVDLYPTIERI
ncbi:hypothetical protein [Nocardia cyriacigeorgica]|uniref:Uncharacterized protein n=1 Tax=Nocardia cyriacigeorgica TaxID=135487 RepID=A0A2L2JWZ6_9NOCA|nr:hypothetical protein [Nocardia cyriacigeorgica]AVH24297.1 hypothetical protein C5B73_25660 [Nocardia cyriacigeorgica]MBF6084242.1 hypothetical protein [Nocardia cyriacigeorgica]MBF6286857.1 hypothetical protein [Nocardia cyriacigeorgica]NEW32338.1 hypothetical protein [Nocardia cyriacigeorgica]PPJ16098.1 hypothetical protein C5E43_03435 [Nocardia cyriacigeorgica]